MRNDCCICNNNCFLCIIAIASNVVNPRNKPGIIITNIDATRFSSRRKTTAGIRCNCMIDYTTGGHSNDNTTGITIPGVRLLKHETLLSQTEGGLSWIAIKPTHLMSILMKDFSLGNFSSGTGATVALNTINVSPNESLGVKI